MQHNHNALPSMAHDDDDCDGIDDDYESKYDKLKVLGGLEISLKITGFP